MTPIFHLFFMHWRHYPPIWMSPSDYQSFIYFRAVSHKKRVYKSVTCHRFLPSLLLEPVCWVTPVTRVFSFFVEGSVTPVTHWHCEKNGYLFLLPSTICFFRLFALALGYHFPALIGVPMALMGAVCLLVFHKKYE